MVPPMRPAETGLVSIVEPRRGSDGFKRSFPTPQLLENFWISWIVGHTGFEPGATRLSAYPLVFQNHMRHPHLRRMRDGERHIPHAQLRSEEHTSELQS